MKNMQQLTMTILLLSLSSMTFCSYSPNKINYPIKTQGKKNHNKSNKKETSRPLQDWEQSLQTLEPLNKYTKKISPANSPKVK
jgi:hypothetical protein